MAFEYARLLDDFNRSDANPLDGGYGYVSGSFQKLVSNTVAPTAAGDGRHNSIATGFGPVRDGGFFVEIAVFEDWQVIGCRWQSPSNGRNGYYFQHNNSNTNWDLRNYINDADGTTIATGGGQSMSAGDAIGIQAIGNVISGWIRMAGVWQMVGQGTDTAFASGYGAMEQASTAGNGRLDNFWGGALPVPGFTSRIRRSRGGVWT